MNERKNDGGPAFPSTFGHADHKPSGTTHHGMSLRDWLAGQALAGLIANPNTPDQLIGLGFEGSKDLAATYAYAAADAMLTERERTS